MNEPAANTGALHESVRLERMRWWQLEDVAALDAVLFGRDAWSQRFFWTQLAAPGVQMTVALERGNLAGYVGVSVSGPQGDITTIGVAPLVQGRGVGRHLLDHAIEHAKARGVEALHLEAADSNDAALSLYRARGFEEIGRRARYYTHADALLMRALL